MQVFPAPVTLFWGGLDPILHFLLELFNRKGGTGALPNTDHPRDDCGLHGRDPGWGRFTIHGLRPKTTVCTRATPRPKGKRIAVRTRATQRLRRLSFTPIPRIADALRPLLPQRFFRHHDGKNANRWLRIRRQQRLPARVRGPLDIRPQGPQNRVRVLRFA